MASLQASCSRARGICKTATRSWPWRTLTQSPTTTSNSMDSNSSWPMAWVPRVTWMSATGGASRTSFKPRTRNWHWWDPQAHNCAKPEAAQVRSSLDGGSEVMLTDHHQWCIYQAAALLGQTSSEFCETSAILRANYLLAHRSRMSLTAADCEFLNAGQWQDGGGDPTLQADYPSPTQEPIGPFPPIHPLGLDSDTAAFDCGDGPLNHWLSRLALASQLMRHMDTWVVSVAERVVGFYSLAWEEIAVPWVADPQTPGSPSPKVMLLTRLAVTKDSQG